MACLNMTSELECSSSVFHRPRWNYGALHIGSGTIYRQQTIDITSSLSVDIENSLIRSKLYSPYSPKPKKKNILERQFYNLPLTLRHKNVLSNEVWDESNQMGLLLIIKVILGQILPIWMPYFYQKWHQNPKVVQGDVLYFTVELP